MQTLYPNKKTQLMGFIDYCLHSEVEPTSLRYFMWRWSNQIIQQDLVRSIRRLLARIF